MELLRFTLQQVSYAIVEPSYACIMVLMAIMFYIKNKKTTVMEKMIMGKNSYSAFELTVSQIVMGIFGGGLASILLTFLGVTFFDTSNIYLLFIISIILMAFKPEYVCFSYSGAILGIASIILYAASVIMNDPSLNILKIEAGNLVILVGVMHMVEGILVMFDGKRGAIPVFGKKEKDIIGGFAYRRQWVLPMIILLIIQSQDPSSSSSGIMTPEWWPILNHEANSALFASVVLSAMPIFAGVNYTSVTFTKGKAQKPLLSGLIVFAYGSFMSFLGLFGGINTVIDLAILIAMPLCHKYAISLDKKIESKGQVKYVSNDDGVCVLAVAPDSIAKTMGLTAGDIILEVNNIKVVSDEIIFKVIEKLPHSVTMKVKKANGAIIELLGKTTKEEKLGCVIVPRKIPERATVTRANKGDFDEILRKIRERKNKK